MFTAAGLRAQLSRISPTGLLLDTRQQGQITGASRALRRRNFSQFARKCQQTSTTRQTSSPPVKAAANHYSKVSARTATTSTPSATSTPSPRPLASSTATPSKPPSSYTKAATTAQPAKSPANNIPIPHDLTTGLQDPLPAPSPVNSANEQVDWSRSFHGLSTTAFSKEASDILQEPVTQADVEVKPDGIIYLPEIKYRRILNRAFGPGAWGLAPRGETIVTPKSVTREYGLVVHGRLVSIARGEQQYFDPEGIPTATEGCKSNSLMRCCKDLGIASELWDPVFVRKFTANHAKELWVEHITTKKKKKIWMRKDVLKVPYPFKEAKL